MGDRPIPTVCIYIRYDIRHVQIEGGSDHSKQREDLMLGSEGAEANVFSLWREAQRAQEQRDGREGKKVCCERESAYEDIDLASVEVLVKFWESIL